MYQHGNDDGVPHARRGTGWRRHRAGGPGGERRGNQRIQSEPAFLELENERARTDARIVERTVTLGHGTALARTLGKRCGAIDGSFFNTTPEGGTRLSTSLESGVLSLLVDERSGEFCLQYFGR